MKRILSIAVVACMFATSVKADDEFFLKADGSVEKRVAAVETDVAKLKSEVEALKAALNAGNTVAVQKPAAKPKTAAAPERITFQLCVNGRCTNHECDDMSKVPLGARNVTKWLAPTSDAVAVSDCPCGPGCPCAANAAALAATTTFSSAGSCASGSCSTADTGWYPGKNLGRRR